MRVRSWPVIALLAVGVVPTHSYPCSPRFSSYAVRSPWDAELDPIVPVRPVVFSRNAEYDVPTQMVRHNETVAIAFEPAPHDPLLDRVTGMTFLVATSPLEPDVYCVGGCVTVTASFDTREPDIAPSLSALKSRDYGKNGCGEDDFCSATVPRHAAVDLQLIDDAPERIAGWFVEYAAKPSYADAPAVLITGYSYLELSDGNSPDLDFEDLRRICVQIRSVLWDGTVGAPHDLGCAAFE